jgi:hypothetical protein
MADWTGTPLTGREQAIMDAIMEVVADAIRTRDAWIGALEVRLAKVEESKRLSYRGVFAAQEQYDAGDYVTHGGSLWCCLRDTTDMPGRSASWRLAANG